MVLARQHDDEVRNRRPHYLLPFLRARNRRPHYLLPLLQADAEEAVPSADAAVVMKGWLMAADATDGRARNQPAWCSLGHGARTALLVAQDGSLVYSQTWFHKSDMVAAIDAHLADVAK